MTIDRKIMPVTLCDNMGKLYSSPDSFKSRIPTFGGRDPSALRIAEFALQELEAARARDVAAHEANLPAMENNELIARAIHELNEAVGMPPRYKVRDTSSRARLPKYLNPQAGYITDVMREVRTSDSFAQATNSYEAMKKNYTMFHSQAIDKDRLEREKKARAEEERKALRRANVELATIVLRYGLDVDSEWGDVLEKLRERHQRVDLAVAMMNVRHDWSEGPDEVSNAIDRFKCDTPEDIEIANSILRNLGEGWDGDGRCFRDCNWNYDRLMASIEDKQLAADVSTAYGHVKD